MLSIRSIRKSHFIVYVIIITISFWNDFHFFDFSYTQRNSIFVAAGNPHAVLFYILIKALAIMLLYVFFSYVVYCWTKVLEHDQKIIFKLKIYALIAGVYGLVFIHMYPGLWYNIADELPVFNYARCLQIQYHQGTVMAVCYILALMIWPKPAMVVIFQLVIGTLVLGNVVTDIYNKNKMQAISFLLVVFSPASLYYANYPMRAYLFSVLFLAFAHYWLRYYGRKMIGREIIMITFLMCLVVNFRTEAKFLLLIFPFLLIGRCSKRQLVCAECVVLASMFIVSGVNSLGNQHSYQSHNSIMVIGPLSEYLTDSNRYDPIYDNDVKIIDKVLSVDDIKKNASYNYFGGTRADSEYTDEEFKGYLKSVANILVHNPDVYIKVKMKCLFDSIGLTALNWFNTLSGMNSFSWIGNEFPKEFPDSIKGGISSYFQDFDKDSHNLFTRIIAGQYKIGTIKMYCVFYAFWIPCFLMAVIVVACFRREQCLAIMSSIVLCHLCLTMLTAPSRFQMYYFPEYLIGWYIAIRAFGNIKARKIYGRLKITFRNLNE